MRNLKKVLSLALALVMLVGMMVVGAGATSFADDASIQNKEAVSVLSGMGIVKGRDDGSSFDPTGTLTRAEAAMMIAQLDLGVDAAAALKANGTNPFTDVAANHWAAGAIDYCVEQGYIRGDGNGHFFPGNNVTGVEFGIMLTSLLGYDTEAEGVTGSDWQSKGAALARRAGLTSGVAANTSAMTRDGMAQMAFNALTADMVDYPNGTGTSITLPGGGSITTGAKAEPITYTAADNSNSVKGYNGDTVVDGQSKKLCEEKFPGLKLDTDDTDDFNRSASTWSYNKEALFTKANAADVTITEKVATEAALKKLLPKGVTAVKDNKVTPDYFGGGSGAVTNLAGVAGLTGSGKRVEISINDDNEIDGIIVTTYTVEKVKAITEKNDKTTYTFTVTTGSYVNDEDATNCVVTGAVEKDDVVTTVKTGSKIYVYPTESFTGNQTAKKTSSSSVTTLTINGDAYVLGTDVKNAAAANVDAADFTNSDKDATYYVDVNGFIVMAEDVEVVAPEYAMVVDAAGVKTNATLDSATGYTMEVRAVLADGTVQDFALALHNGDHDANSSETAGNLYCGKLDLGDGDDGSYDIQDAVTAVKGKTWGYTLNDDGEMVLENTQDASSLSADVPARVISNTDYTSGNTTGNDDVTALFNSKTVFVLYSVDAATKKVTVEAPITGVANLKVDKINNGDLQAIVTGTGTRGTASVVFLKGSAASVKDYVYVDATENNVVGKNYVYTGILPDGSTEEVTRSTALASNAGGLYEYDVDTLKLGDKVEGEDASDAAAKGKVYKDVTAKTDGNMLKVGDSWIEITDTPVTSVVSGVDSEVVDGCTLLIVMDSESASKIAGIYVTAAAPAGIGATASATTATIEGTGTQNITVTIPTLDGDVTVTPTAASDEENVATVGAWDATDKKFTITGVAAGTATVTITLTPSNLAKYSVQTIAVTVTVKDDVPGSYAAVDKTDVTPTGKTAASAFTFTKPATVTENITAANFTYTTKGSLPAGITSVTYDASGNATVTGSANTTDATVTVTVAPKAGTDAAKYFKATNITITITALTGTWS